METTTIESMILREYPELELISDEPVKVNDNMIRVAWTITPREAFDKAIHELFAHHISDFFRSENDRLFIPEGDNNGVRKYTSTCLAKKVKCDRVAHCFTLACWGPALDFDAVCKMIGGVDEPDVAALDERYGRSLMKTVVGDRYVFTHCITIEPAFPTKYIRELSNLGYDVHYISSEEEQLENLRQLAESKNDEVLKSTY
jgi:hypothetical protein